MSDSQSEMHGATSSSSDINLSPEETETLLQFQDITGVESIESCRDILARNNWNLEHAVQETFNERENVTNQNLMGLSTFLQTVPPQRPTRPRSAQAPSGQLNLHPPRSSGQLERMSFFTRIRNLLILPFRFVFSSVFSLLNFAYRLVSGHRFRDSTPLEDIERFISHFERQYGTPHPVFYQGSYNQATADAKREVRFLLVYLHSADHQDTAAFCRNTLCAQPVIDFINSRTLFWACDVSSPEGFRVSRVMRENSYPFLALLAVHQSRMAIIGRIERALTPEELCNRLQQYMSNHEPVLAQARAQREELNFNQSLRAQQDDEYQRSLLADQEKEKRRREEVEAQLRDEKAKRDEEEAAKEEARRLSEKRQRLRDGLPLEPAGSELVKLIIRMPNGSRLERKFHRTDSVKRLAEFVFCQDEAPSDFQVLASYPRRELPCHSGLLDVDDSEVPTFSDVGLTANETLHVQDNEA